MTKRTTALGIAIAVSLGTAARPPHGRDEPDNRALDRLREALQKYQDPVVAIHDGYFSTLGCVEFERPGEPGHVPYQPGAMGVHFLNVQAIGPVPDPNRPQVLL